MACGYVIEFQHSSITAEEFNERNRFYLDYGNKVIWIFDFSDEFESNQIEWYECRNSNNKYKWKYAKRFLRDFLPQENKKVTVFFQLGRSDHSNNEVGYIERVIWAIEDDEGYSNFKRFVTANNPDNFLELLECIKKQRL